MHPQFTQYTHLERYTQGLVKNISFFFLNPNVFVLYFVTQVHPKNIFSRQRSCDLVGRSTFQNVIPQCVPTKSLLPLNLMSFANIDYRTIMNFLLFLLYNRRLINHPIVVFLPYLLVYRQQIYSNIWTLITGPYMQVRQIKTYYPINIFRLLERLFKKKSCTSEVPLLMTS